MIDLDELEDEVNGGKRGEWIAYFTGHGDPFVVPADMPYPSSAICQVNTGAADYGRGNAIAIAAAHNAIPELVERLRFSERFVRDYLSYARQHDPGTENAFSLAVAEARSRAAEGKL